jgi:hypothetical protein
LPSPQVDAVVSAPILKSWCKSAWTCLCLAFISIVYGAFFGATKIPHEEETARLIPIIGAQFGWGAGLGWASVGAVAGLYGMSKRAERTNSARAAIVLNLIVAIVCLLAVLKLTAR